MAEIAIGRSCPRCGTLTAISGAFADPILHGVCACCGYMVSATAFGGERAHAVRAASIPKTAQGEAAPIPALPSVAPAPQAITPPTPVSLPQAAASVKRGNEKRDADAA